MKWEKQSFLHLHELTQKKQKVNTELWNLQNGLLDFPNSLQFCSPQVAGLEYLSHARSLIFLKSSSFLPGITLTHFKTIYTRSSK